MLRQNSKIKYINQSSKYHRHLMDMEKSIINGMNTIKYHKNLIYKS